MGDTWRLPEDPVAFVYDSRDKTVFIGGLSSDSVLVLDEHTIEPIGWIDAGAPVPVLVYCRGLNKLYCLQSGAISVYDAFTHVRLKVIPASIQPKEACLDSENNKLYVFSEDSSPMAVVDCNTDSVVAVLHGLNTDEYSRQSCYVPGWNRIYFCDTEGSSVVVIDCRSDTVLARVSALEYPIGLCYNDANNRVYVAIDVNSGPYGIDVASNTIVSSAHCFEEPLLCCNPRDNKLYGWCDDGIGVYNCLTDSLVTAVPFYGAPQMLSYSPTANKVYSGEWGSGDDGGITVIDGEGDSLIDHLAGVAHPCALGIASGENLVFLTGSDDPGLMVVDGDRDCLVRVLSSYYELTGACSDIGKGKVICATSFPPGLEVMDAGSGQATAFIPTGHVPVDLCCDTVNQIVYVVGGDDTASITVVDVLGDSVVNTVHLAGWHGDATRICADSRDRKVYIGAGSGTLLVYNWSCDSLIGMVRMWYGVKALSYHEAGNRVYCGTSFGIVEVSCATDEVVRTTNLECTVSQPCFGSVGDRLYCLDDAELVTVNCRTAGVIGRVTVPGRGSALCYNPTDDKVYCGGTSDSVSVHAGSDGRLLATLATGPIPGSGSFAYDSRSNTVLCASAERHSITSIDGESDRVLRTLTIPETPLSVVAAGAHPFSFAPCNGSQVAVIRMDTVPAGFGVAAAPGRTSGSLVRDGLFSTDKPGSVLMNAAGRKVLDLHPGVNDVGGLPSGVYFVREQSAIRKVVITR